MNEFIQMVFSELRSSIAEAVFMVLLAAGALFYIYRRHKRKYGGEKPFPWKQAALILLLVGYMAVVGYATMGRLGGYGAGGANFHLFRAWREAWNYYSVNNWANVLLNVLLFVPLGVLVPLVFPKCQKGLRMFAVGFGTSVLIELLQWLRGSGIFDVDDLFANTLGAVMGYGCLMAVLSAVKKQWGRGAAFAALALVPAAAVGSIFVAYELQPYGNLMEDYIYRIDTGDVTWSMECELPEMPETAAVYQAPAMTVAECDEFALAFAEHWGGEYDDTFYYDKETYFRDYDTGDWIHYLTVSRLDGGYDYYTTDGSHDQDTSWAELDRAAVEEMLAGYGITVPAAAEFSYDGQEWHSFTAEQIIEGDMLWEGALRFSYASDGSTLDIENHLVAYVYAATETIISAEEAYQRLCNGYFNGGWFERQTLKAVSVLSCTLGYEIDTKGFYQPVYYFDVMAPEWDDQDTILIPAIP